MTVAITVNGEALDVPSSAADTNWASQQVAFEQALVAYVDDVSVVGSDLALAVKPAAVVGTAGSGTGISAAATSYGRNTVHVITVAYTALAVAATTADVTLWTLPAKTRVLRVIADVTTKFIGGAISACALVCGNSAGGTQYLLTGDIFTAAVVRGDGQAELGAGIVGGAGFSTDITWASTTVAQCRFTSTTANLNALTQGVVTFYIETCTYP